jgi:rRNA maturation protein Nop10
MSGTYTARANVPGCGGIVATTSVIVNPGVTNIVAGSSSPLCAGQNLTLSATAVAGASYIWRGPLGYTANTRIASRTNVNTSMSGIYTLEVSQPGCGGARFLNVTVMVSNATPPVASVNSSPACVGNVVYLNSTAVSGATSYQWSGPNAYVASGITASISNVQMNRAGIYTLTVAHPSCGVFTTSVNLTVNPVVSTYTLLAASPGCVGSTLSLSTTIPTGGTVTHLWTAPNGNTFTSASLTINNAQLANAGTYTHTATSPGCGTNTRTIRYVVNDPASVVAGGSGVVCRGQAAYFNVSAPANSTFNWQGPAAYAATGQFPSRSNVALTHSGIYTVNANVPGCGIVTRTTSLLVNNCRTAQDASDPDGSSETIADNLEVDQIIPNAENEAKLSSLKVYPNPFHEEVSLSWSDMKVFSVKLYDLSGKLVYEAEPKDEGTQYVVKTADLPNGVYLLMVQTSAGPVSYRVTRL